MTQICFGYELDCRTFNLVILRRRQVVAGLDHLDMEPPVHIFLPGSVQLEVLVEFDVRGTR